MSGRIGVCAPDEHPGVVWIEYDERGVIDDLNPGEARELAQRLIEAAEYAER